MARSAAQTWNLRSFLDSLILELDRAQDTLSIKGLTRKLTYTVKDVALDLFIFPHYEDGSLRFSTAKPGDEGASKLSFQLGSITDRQIRDVANEPPHADDVTIDVIEDLDEEVRDSLEKVGVKSSRDLERISSRNVDVNEVVKEKTGRDKSVSYEGLAQMIKKARRQRSSPRVSKVSAARSGRAFSLTLTGDNLVPQPAPKDFPLAVFNDAPVDITDAEATGVTLRIPEQLLREGANELKVALDPYALITLDLNAR